MTGPAPAAGSVPVGPMLSMYDPIHVGSDEFGQPFYIRLIYKNLLAAGEPGGGKSGTPRVWWRLDSPQMLWSGWPLSSTVPPPGGTTV